ncbi:MAG TPA: hypothetical protein VMR76_02245 [Candidatus Saccharimonadia bacterium]|nr:hypothetical protein [Candidatus Saccharimonadia bacterium]
MSNFECRGEDCINFGNSEPSCEALGKAINALPWDSDPQIGSYDTDSKCPRDTIAQMEKHSIARGLYVLTQARIIELTKRG